MSISKISTNRWLVRVRKTVNGRIYNRIKTVDGFKLDANRTEVNLSTELKAKSSLKSLKIIFFSQALAYFQENTDADLSHAKTYLRRLKRDLGGIAIVCLAEHFDSYWKRLKTEKSKTTGKLLNNVTINKLLVYSKCALNFCVKRGLIEKNPLKPKDKLPETARDRILTDVEMNRILNIMALRKSYLYWAFYFSLKNPTRIGDLRELTRENLDYFKPWVHFLPSKTRKRIKRETCLPFLDEPLMDYFKSLPDDCPYLFPRIDEKGSWHKLNAFRKHWYSILDEAKVTDFRWHDLKHCAITWMLDNGHTEQSLKNYGIQYSREMIDRYYHFDAEKEFEKWQSDAENDRKNIKMALQNGTHGVVSL